MRQLGIFKLIGRLGIAGTALTIIIVGSQTSTPATADIRASFRFNGAARHCADLLAPCLSLDLKKERIRRDCHITIVNTR